MLQRDIADADQPSASSIALLPHRLPDFCIVIGPVVIRWPVKQKAIHMIGTEMFERTGQRLHDLNREARLWIVWQTMILTTLVGKFCLQKEIVSRHDALAVSRCQAFSHPASK